MNAMFAGDPHGYCRGRIRLARIEAKEKGIKIPPFGGATLVGYEQWGMFFGDLYTECGACCAYEARAFAIEEIIQSHDENREIQDVIR